MNMNKEDRIWTIPNGLSLLRFFLIIPILIALDSGRPWLAVILMLAAGATDMLDGWLARRLDQRSNIGRISDPVIDKLAVLAIVFYMIMSPKYVYPLWFFLVQLSRESLILLGGLLIIGKRKIIMESNVVGKMAALANGIVVLLFIFNFRPYNWIFLTLTLGLMVVSTFKYGLLFFSQLNRSPGGPDRKRQETE